MLDLLLSTMINLQDLNTEIQVNVCDVKNSISEKIDLSSWQQKKEISTYYVENPQLGLFNQGLVFRIRLDLKKNKAEVTLKHNTPIDRLTDSYSSDMESKPVKCEYDLHGEDMKLACKMENKISISEFDKAKADNYWKSLLSSEQLAWLKSENIKLPQNLLFTSAFNESSYVRENGGQNIELSIVTNGQGQEFIEASVRSASTLNVDHSQKKLLNYLNGHNVLLCKDQSAILTRKKLESFFRTRN